MLQDSLGALAVLRNVCCVRLRDQLWWHRWYTNFETSIPAVAGLKAAAVVVAGGICSISGNGRGGGGGQL